MAKSAEFRKFDDLTGRLLAVPREVLQRRLEQHRQQAADNPNKRGPKPKTAKSSTSDPDEGET